MKRNSLCIYLILTLTTSLIAVDESYITVEFDRFKNETKINGGYEKFTKLLFSKVQPRLNVQLSFKGRVPSSTPPSVILSIFRLGSEKEFGEIWKVYFLADGEPVKAGGIVRRSRRLETGELYEMIAFREFEFDDFLKLANAKEVEFKIINDDFKASAEEMTMLKQVRDEYMKLKKQKK